MKKLYCVWISEKDKKVNAGIIEFSENDDIRELTKNKMIQGIYSSEKRAISEWAAVLINAIIDGEIDTASGFSASDLNKLIYLEQANS